MSLNIVNSPKIEAPPFDDSDLKSYWKYDETGGNIIGVSQSISALGNDLTPTDPNYSQTPLASDLGNSMLLSGGFFDGVGAGSPDYNFMHDNNFLFSLAWWGTRTAFDGTLQMIFNHAGEWSSSEVGFGCRYSSVNGSMDTRFANGTNTNRFVPTFTGLIQDSNPHFFTITADVNDATNTIELFQDGISLGIAAKGTSAFSDGNPTSKLVIGATDIPDQIWRGFVSEMSVWNRRLSDEEILELYNLGNGRQIY